MSASIEPLLREALRTAMRGRDQPALRATRSALARLANAEAVPVESVPAAGAVEAAALGVGAADAPRRELTEDERHALVLAEADELDDSAAHYDVAGRGDEADQCRSGAAFLRELLTRARD